MGLFVYVSKQGCGTCKHYEQNIEFNRLKGIIDEYTTAKIKFVKVIGNDIDQLANIHMSLIRIEMFPTLFYIDDVFMNINIPSLELSKVYGQIFENHNNLVKWIMDITHSDNINVSPNFFDKREKNYAIDFGANNKIKTFEYPKLNCEIYQILDLL